MSTNTKLDFDPNDTGLTLRELHKRLGEIIEYHEERGWGERNDQPVILTVAQEKTPTGRTRPPVNIPVHRACSGSYGYTRDENNKSVWATQLLSKRVRETSWS